MPRSEFSPPLLAMDTASPTVSVALGRRGEPYCVRSIALRRSSENLLQMVDELLREADLTLRDLGGVVALRGPGSFTGVRVGLATALGFHQAIGLPATGLSSLEALAMVDARSRPESGKVERTDREIVAMVDALRGQWFAQRFRVRSSKRIPESLSEPSIIEPSTLLDDRPASIVGFGVSKLATDPILEGPAPESDDLGESGESSSPFEPDRLVEPQELASATLDLAFARDLDRSKETGWSPDLLIEPLYLRQPFVTPSKAARRSAKGQA